MLDFWRRSLKSLVTQIQMWEKSSLIQCGVDWSSISLVKHAGGYICMIMDVAVTWYKQSNLQLLGPTTWQVSSMCHSGNIQTQCRCSFGVVSECYSTRDISDTFRMSFRKCCIYT